MSAALRIRPEDDVAVALEPIGAGETVLGVTAREDIPAGHKLALTDLPEGCAVRKYGMPIGHATRAIRAGEWVHTHNLATSLAGEQDYRYEPAPAVRAAPFEGEFMGYLRADGRVGVRNELWILPTVGCVNGAAQRLAERARAELGVPACALTHPYGCSQLGEDHANTQRVLCALARHPNAGGVLVLGLGCENNHLGVFREALGPVDPDRVRFLNAQDVEDEVEAGMEALRALAAVLREDRRTPQPLNRLVLGLKCGGSDGYSGLTANPLLGALSDGVCAAGGSALLTEVPEMFGAETLLMARCADRQTFEDTVEMINGFKRYFEAHGQPVYENPSPGNREGGITTLEEKSLGCTQKGGSGPVCDVLAYAQPVRRRGLSLVYGPGNDLCACTALAAAGAQLILFTTGRGTPLGAPVPVLKVATNHALARKKPGWIDFDAGCVLEEPMDAAARRLMRLTLAVACGQETCSEKKGYRDLAIFKDGVTL